MEAPALPPLRRLLAPLDGSRLAEAILPALVSLAGRLQAGVTLLHVLEQHAPAAIHGERHLSNVIEAEAYLHDIAARLRADNITSSTHVHADGASDVAQSIVAHAHELAADLVVLCAHGRGGLRGMLYGRIAQQVLHRGGRPILLIAPTDTGATPPFEPRVVLIPLDGTPAHEPALPIATAIARAFGAELYLIMVVPTLATLPDERAAAGLLLPTTMRAVLDLNQQSGSDYLEQVAAHCRAGGLAVSTEVLRGDTVPAVLACSRRTDVDLLVLATHGRAGIEAILAGSVAPRVAERARCPLLLVHAGDGAATHRQ